jgi:hypothetical protein
MTNSGSGVVSRRGAAPGWRSFASVFDNRGEIVGDFQF